MDNTSTHTDDTTVRLPRDLVEQIRKLSIAHDRSLSGELREALRFYVYVTGQHYAGDPPDYITGVMNAWTGKHWRAK